jgi:dTDP-4-amino-4,6-dideoxygalactose transaminase
LNVPFLDLTRIHGPLKSDIEGALRSVMESGQFILGDEVTALEESLAMLFGVPHAIAVASGTDALYLALAALDVGDGDEVITTPFTFIATGTAILRAGARPVFADIDGATFNLDPVKAEGVATDRTRAILPVDLYGACAPWEEFESLAASRGIALVEDAAQSIGASRNGRMAGSFGDAAAFSFYPTKNLGGMGDGGLVTTRSEDLARRVRLLRAHGDAGGYEHMLVGINSRMDAFQAAVLRVKLRRLEEWNRERRTIASAYTSRLAGIPGAGQLSNGAAIQTPYPGEATHQPVWHQYVIRCRDRDLLAAFLRQRGIGCGVYYPVPLHMQPCFAALGVAEGALPEAERACREVLALPVYPGLREEEIEAVCEAIASFTGSVGR